MAPDPLSPWLFADRIWLNGSAEDVEIRLPENEWVQTGTVVLSTDEKLTPGTTVSAGESLVLTAQSLVVLEEDPRD